MAQRHPAANGFQIWAAHDRAMGSLARHRVRDGIQQLILSGEYRAGQRLRQQELAARFDVAQGVVREALLELQFCGLVEAVDNLGMFVSGLEVRDLFDAYEIREVIEGLAARLCCERASRADIRDLKELAEQVHICGEKGDVEAMGAADKRFHHRTVSASGNEMLAKVTAGYRMLGMFVRADRKRKEVDQEHREIVRAIEANDPNKAELLARQHVAKSREAIARQVAQGEFVPRYVKEAEDIPPAANGAAGAIPTPTAAKRRRSVRKA
jgi:DNA-binding GntR family transcriptional regulator